MVYNSCSSFSFIVLLSSLSEFVILSVSPSRISIAWIMVEGSYTPAANADSVSES